MRNRDNGTRSELLDSLHQRIQTEKSLLQRRLDHYPAEVDDPGRVEKAPRRRKRRPESHPAEAEEPGHEEGPPRPRRTGRLYKVFLALSVPEGES